MRRAALAAAAGLLAATGCTANASGPALHRSTETIGPAPVRTPNTPDGVEVSGAHAMELMILSFTAKNDTFGYFAPVLRVRNVGPAPVEFASVTVTALVGQTVKGVARDFVNGLRPGDTTTVEAYGTDKGVIGTKDLRFAVELG